MAEIKECVLVDGVRTPNGRAHPEKGWFKNVRPDELLTYVYKALFERNQQVKPEDVEAVFVGTANQTGQQNDQDNERHARCQRQPGQQPETRAEIFVRLSILSSRVVVGYVAPQGRVDAQRHQAEENDQRVHQGDDAV